MRASSHMVPSHMRSICIILAVESMETGTYPLHTGSQVLSPEHDMDGYMTTLFGGEAWGLVLKVGSNTKLDPNLNTSPANNMIA
jgi:hypothetical protein